MAESLIGAAEFLIPNKLDLTTYQEYKGFLFKKWRLDKVDLWRVTDRYPEELGNVMVFKMNTYSKDQCIEIFKNEPDFLYGEPDRFKFNV